MYSSTAEHSFIEQALPLFCCANICIQPKVFLPYIYHTSDDRYYIWAFNFTEMDDTIITHDRETGADYWTFKCKKYYWDGKMYFKSLIDSDGVYHEYYTFQYSYDRGHYIDIVDFFELAQGWCWAYTEEGGLYRDPELWTEYTLR